MKEKLAIIFLVIVSAILCMVHIIFLLFGNWSGSDATRVQYPAQEVQPLFYNSSIVTESTEGDVNILTKLLSLHHAVIVLLYSHKNYRSLHAAYAFGLAAQKFVDFSEYGWLAINCAHNCGQNVDYAQLPQVQYYKKNKNDTLPDYIPYYGDITSVEEIATFVFDIIHPINIISSKEELKEMKENSSPYIVNGELWVYPSNELLSSEIALDNAMREARILRRDGIKTNFLLFDQRQMSTASLDVHWASPVDTTFKIFSTKKIQNSQSTKVMRLTQRFITGGKNNWIWKKLSHKFLKSGYLLLMIDDGLENIQEVNSIIERLSECKSLSVCLSTLCFASSSELPDNIFQTMKPNGCKNFDPKNFWGQSTKVCCYDDEEDVFNPLCKNNFNRTLSVISLPKEYSIVFDRFIGQQPALDRPLLIDFLSEQAIQQGENETLEDFLTTRIPQETYFDEPQLYSESFSAENASHISISTVSGSEGDDFESTLEQFIWGSRLNRLILLTSTPCGYCDAAMRALLNAKLFLQERVNSTLMGLISFSTISADNVHLPSWLNFKTFPQLLLIPSDSTSGDSIIFENYFSSPKLVKFIVQNVDMQLRLLLAIELKGGNANKAILSSWNIQQSKIDKLEDIIQREKFEHLSTKTHLKESGKSLSDLRKSRKSQEEKIKRVEELVKSLSSVIRSDETVNETSFV